MIAPAEGLGKTKSPEKRKNVRLSLGSDAAPFCYHGRMAEYRLSIRLTPKASRDQVVSWEEDVLRVRVAAPPVEGRANQALLRLLARALDVPQSRLTLVVGQTQRNKVVAVEGLTEEEARARLAAAIPSKRS